MTNVACLIVLFLVITFLSTASEAVQSTKIKAQVQNCNGNLTLSCDPQWKLHRKGKTLTILLSKSPRAELIVEETPQRIHFMHELRRDALESTKRYAKGFQIKRYWHPNLNREVIRVEGFLRGNPNQRVYDVYLRDNLKVHSVRFTAARDVFKDYAPLIQHITENVDFTDHSRVQLFAENFMEGKESPIRSASMR